MRPEHVPEELMEAADLALANACEETVHDDTCSCPTDEQVRIILAATIPRVLERAAEAVENEAAGPGHGLGEMDAGIFHSARYLRNTGWGFFDLPGHKKRLLRSQRIVDEVLGPPPGTGA